MEQKIAKYTIDELNAGYEVRERDSLTQDDIQKIRKCHKCDFNPLHTNIKYPQANGFENIIAHGLLLSSFSSKLSE